MGLSSQAIATALAAINVAPVAAALTQLASRTSYQITGSAASNVLTVAAGSWAVADGKRISLTGTLPPELVSGSVYWVKRISATTFSVASSRVNFLSSTFVTPSTAIAAGQAVGFDLDLDGTDFVTSLVSYEAVGTGYARQSPAFSTPSQLQTIPVASESSVLIQFQNTGTVVYVVTHLLILYGGSTTIGSTTTTHQGVTVVTGDQNVQPSSSIALNVKLRGTAS